jgi:pimeloyl-ACP methyl ester carboxylesterase
MTSIEPHQAGTDQLYWEARGSGRPVLLIAGTPGDGGQFDRVVAPLAEDHLVITYDRRGTSRSGRAAGWDSTSVVKHADDAAEVLAAVGVGDAIVFGTSNGALAALELALRHPRRVAGLMMHEPPLLSVLHDPEPVASAMGSVIGAAMDDGGPRAALEAFLRFAFGSAVVDGWPVELRCRMLANAEMVFSVEMPAFQAYSPDPGALARCEVPVRLIVGEQQQLPIFGEAAAWLAGHLRTEVTSIAGAHGPQFSHPEALAATIRAFADSL